MELLLKREQQSGALGGIKFYLTAMARLTPDETSAVSKYKMGKTILYEKPNSGPNPASLTSLLAHRFLVPRVDVNDLVNGKTVEAKDIIEILGAEEQLRDAAKMFHKMLMAAKTFGGEKVETFVDEE